MFVVGSNLGFKVKVCSCFSKSKVVPLVGSADPPICGLRVLRHTSAAALFALEAHNNLRGSVTVTFSKLGWELAHLNRKRTLVACFAHVFALLSLLHHEL